MDFINLMAYDLRGAWEDVTGHQSGLYARSNEAGKDSQLNVVRVASYLFYYNYFCKINKWREYELKLACSF